MEDIKGGLMGAEYQASVKGVRKLEQRGEGSRDKSSASSMMTEFWEIELKASLVRKVSYLESLRDQ